METQVASTAPETKTAKLIFRTGKWTNKKTGHIKDVFISKFDGKIVYADTKFNIRTGVSYTCEMSLSHEEKAYDVSKANKTPVTKANLVFKKGKRMHNEKTNDYVENMVSTFDGQIVIAPESLYIEPQKEYSVEMVLSPNGKAYIAETAELTAPAKAEIVAHESPLSIVEVIIDGDQQDDLRFDCMGGDEKMLQSKISNLRNRSIADKDMFISNYEATCREMMNQHLSKIKCQKKIQLSTRAIWKSL
jgi:hypothetical protein